MTSPPTIWALVPAAGTGSRMASRQPKQYLPLLDRPVILHTLERFCACPQVRGVMAGIAPDDAHWAAVDARAACLHNFLGTYAGGRERADTVLNGLKALLGQGASDDDWVMVHDAARPCVRQADLERLISTVLGSPDGGLLALPMADTVKRVDGEQRVLETVPRSGLWRALTPQMFRVGRLREALEQAQAAGLVVTDEASAIEYAHGRPLVVAGHADNIKITLPGDLQLAELFLRQQREEG